MMSDDEANRAGAVYSPESSDGLSAYWPIWLLVGVVIGAFVYVSITRAEDAPKQTNGERGMLRYDEVFGPQPKIKLCEIVENGKKRLITCPYPATRRGAR